MSQKVMANPALEEVLRAIDTLHKNQDAQKNRKDMEKADTWLCKFQDSVRECFLTTRITF